ncbi:MAG: copper resistance CopC/CopD family protein, partial [Aggregatilineales bacterium]
LMHHYKRYALLYCFLFLIIGNISVQAHGYIVRAIPEDRARLERPPTRLQYWFSESLEPAFSELKLRDENGVIIAEGAVDDRDDALLALQLPPGSLTDGAYIVELRPAFASDSHVVAESRVFFVGDTDSALSGEAASRTAETLEVIWKTLLYSASYVLFGIYVLYAHVLVPAWGNVKYPAGLLPPRLMQRLNRIVWLALCVAIFANIMALLQQTMQFFNVDALQVLQGGLWQVARIGSRSGDVWNVRLLLLLILTAMHTASIRYRETAPRSVQAFWTGGVWVMALFIGAQAVNSHAAGSLVMPWVALVAHWLHALSVAFWIGGIIALTLILPVALAPYKDNNETRHAALLAVMQRFSRLMGAMLALIITSGIYSASNWFFTPSDLDSNYGFSLLLKLLMVALLVFIGGLHHLALRPYLTEKFAFLAPLVRGASAFKTSLRLAAVVGLLTLLLASWMSATPVPEPEFLQDDIDTPRSQISVDDLDVSLSIFPGGPGVNTYDTVIENTTTDDPVAMDAYAVDLQMVSPERDIRSERQPVDVADAGLYVTANDTIDTIGTWWAILNITNDTGHTQRAAFAFNISADAAVLQSVTPSIQHWLAFLLLLMGAWAVLYPSAKKLYQRLPLDPTTLLLAISMSLISIVVIGGSIIFITEQQNQIDRTLNPLPQNVNSVLPDAASLITGESTFLQVCDWQDESDFRALQRSLNTLRDDELYLAIRDGWRDLAPCDNISETERWHIVNYIRSLHRSD